MNSNSVTITDSERIGRAALLAVEPTFLAPSGDAVGPVEGSNTEDRGGRVGSDALDFGEEDSDRATNKQSLGEKTKMAKVEFLKITVTIEQEPKITH